MLHMNLYDLPYLKRILRNIVWSKIIIASLLINMILFAIISVYFAINETHQWLLILNIPIEIIFITTILVVGQVYLPIYKWELQMVERANNTRQKTEPGIIKTITRNIVYHENQRMITIHFQQGDKILVLFIRPWFLKDLLQNKSTYSFYFNGRVITGFHIEETL